MRNTRRPALAAALALPLLAALPGTHAAAQGVTSEGFAERAAGREFYIEVPMVDSPEDGGIGRNIVAESIINSVRYASGSPEIRHVVFKMNTGGGALHHADPMADIIEEHHNHLEFHIVIEDAISAGIWTAFSCDTIFMCRAGTIGGATAYRTFADGTVEASAGIPVYAARMELTAERNGHPPQVILPMMLLETELHCWRDEDGKVVLTHDAPESIAGLRDYKHLDKKDTVLTLTTEQAIDMGLARPIEAFDASLVGEKIGVPGWTRANRYGLVIDEIGELYNTTRAMEDHWALLQLNLESFPVTPQNRQAQFIKDMFEQRSKHADMVEAFRKMNLALNTLPDVHPERHVYFADEDGQTLVADAEAWREDAGEGRKYMGLMTAALRDLEKAFRRNEIDQDNLNEITDQVRVITGRINGIVAQGNAAYWADARD